MTTCDVIHVYINTCPNMYICLQDGKAHCSLSPKEILYFTLAYDWFAFGYVSVHYLRFHIEKNSSLVTAILSRRDGRKERRLFTIMYD